jgi:3-oxoadipate enol-lactonase
MLRLLKWKSVYGPTRKEAEIKDIDKFVERMFRDAMAIDSSEGKPLPTGDTRKLLPSILVPTHVLAGELDFTDYHRIADFYQQQIPDSKKRMIPHAAHFINLENPERFNQEVIEFLQNL